MKILIVEDDYLQASWLKDVLEDNLSSPGIDIIQTEYEFRNWLGNPEHSPPDVILIDVMLRWTDPRPGAPPAPEDVRENGFFRAGFRCEHLLREHEETTDIPVILYTVLLSEDLGEKLNELSAKTVYVEKLADPEGLLAAINKLIQAS